MTSVEYLLKLVDWQLFFSLTWRDVYERSVDARVADVDEYLRTYATREQVSLSDLPTVIRWERGEQSERPHCHILLTGFPNPASYRKTKRMALMGIWVRRHGLCKVRRWQSELRAELANYLTVGSEWSERRPPSGRITSGNEYEIVKADRADRLVFNEAFWKLLQRKTETCFEVAPTT
jgi:hypothetical protein